MAILVLGVDVGAGGQERGDAIVTTMPCCNVQCSFLLFADDL